MDNDSPVLAWPETKPLRPGSVPGHTRESVQYADEDVDGAALREARPCAYWSYPARQSPGGGDAAASGVGKDIPLPVRYCPRKDSSRDSTAAVLG